MSENIVNKISKAEKEAEKAIESAKGKAHSMVENARKKIESDIESFEEASRENIKLFKGEKKALYKAEAVRLKKEGEAARESYQKDMEKRFSSVQEKVSELVRKELCL